MTEFQGADLAKIKGRQELIGNLLREGLGHPRIGFYHGVSIKAIEYVVAHGFLPGSQSSRPEAHLPQSGDIYLIPTAQTALRLQSQHGILLPEYEGTEALNHAGINANIVAETHYLLQSLSLPFTTENSNAALGIIEEGYINDRRMIEMFFGSQEEKSDTLAIIRSGKLRSDSEIWTAIETARRAKGFIVGIDAAILDSYIPTKGDALCDVRVNCPQGLPINTFLGIEAL